MLEWYTAGGCEQNLRYVSSEDAAAAEEVCLGVRSEADDEHHVVQDRKSETPQSSTHWRTTAKHAIQMKRIRKGYTSANPRRAWRSRTVTALSDDAGW